MNREEQRGALAAHSTPACEALRSALMALMHEKPFVRIGVRELCERAHVSRSTFYTYYDNTDELLCEIEDIHVHAIAELSAAVTDPHVAGIEEMGFYDPVLCYLREHQNDLQALLIDDLQPRFIAKWKAAIKAHLRKRAAVASLVQPTEFCLELAASAVISACSYLLEHPHAASDSEVRTILAKVLAVLDA